MGVALGESAVYMASLPSTSTPCYCLHDDVTESRKL